MASFFNILRRLVHGSPIHCSKRGGIEDQKWVENRRKLKELYDGKWKEIVENFESALKHMEIAEAERASAEEARVVAEKERVIAEHNRVSAEVERSISGGRRGRRKMRRDISFTVEFDR